jgi:6-phosphofructokinase
MGRNAGWIALESGIAGTADVILIPEIPYDLDKVVKKIKSREYGGKLFSIIVVSEGAKPLGGDVVVQKIVKDSPDPIRLGGIGNKLAADLEKRIQKHEIRCTVLGHVQRGGSPITYDRILCTKYGVGAVELIKEERFGNMVSIRNGKLSYAHLENVIGRPKLVDPEGETVRVAKSMGISFGDE